MREDWPWPISASTSCGIKAPNPFWLASRAADRQGLQRRARLQGRLGRRRLEDARRGPADRQRQRPALRRHARPGPPRDRLQQHRADHRPAARGEPARDQAGQARLAGPRAARLADGALRGGEPGRRSCRASRTPAPTASSSISAARTACPSAAWARPSGQVPEYVEMVARWCKQHTRMPVIVKLTPNITDIRKPAEARAARRRRRGLADQHHQLDHGRRPRRDDALPGDRRLRHPWRLLRRGGEADRAQHGRRDRARARRRAGLPISGIGGIETWRDAAEFMALGAGTVQVCTAAMVYGFKIVEEMIAGLSNWMDEKGYTSRRRDRRPRRPARHRLAAPQPRLRRQGPHRPGPLHQVRPLPHRLRGHLATRRSRHLEGRRAALRGDRGGVRRLQPLRRRSARSRTASRMVPLTDGHRSAHRHAPVGGHRTWKEHPNNPAVCGKAKVPEPAE